MILGPGTRLGHYEIVSALGAGGMGEVYRARDMRLKRDVALKILPESFASDRDRLARFQREAEVLAIGRLCYRNDIACRQPNRQIGSCLLERRRRHRPALSRDGHKPTDISA